MAITENVNFAGAEQDDLSIIQVQHKPTLPEPPGPPMPPGAAANTDAVRIYSPNCCERLY